MLATLLDSVEPGRDRPPRREVVALVIGGLRARLGTAAALSVGHARPAALRVAALALVCHAVAQAVAYAGQIVSELLVGHKLVSVSDVGHPMAVLTGVAAILLLARGSYRVGMGLVASTFVLEQWALSWQTLPMRLVVGDFWQLPLAFVVILPLALHGGPVSDRPLRWLLGVPAALVLLPTQFGATLHVQPFALGAVVLVGLALSFVDARAAVAIAVVLIAPILALLGNYQPGWAGDQRVLLLLLMYTVMAVPLIVVGAVTMRRQVKL
jgi:hypothetical protein